MSWSSIDDWCCQVDTATAKANARYPARKSSRKHELITPPTSATSKKRKITDNKQVLKPQPEWDDASVISGRSSPVKQLANLADKCSIKTLPMLNKGKNNFPDSLEKLLGPLERRVIKARDLFLESDVQTLRDYTSRNPGTAREFANCIDDDLVCPNPSPDQVHHYQPFLHPDFVYELLEAAETCEREVRDEAAWNLEVHFPLMVKALKGLRRPGDDCYIKIVPCTTAIILPQFQVPTAAAHKVDFAVTFQPTDPSSQTQKNIDSWRPYMPGGSINHTDYGGLKERLIAISVEMKRTHDDYEKAKFQLIVWQAAQWKKFNTMNFQPEITLGIIIQGHDWYFLPSTQAGNDATQVTWCKQKIGGTNNAFEVYSLVWALRYLIGWAIDSQWGKFKQVMSDFKLPNNALSRDGDQLTEDDW
ncbi:hypothetical protein O1611_g4898 [Lasiodiplodia mahajangana]|uniref:Uncharacterized protein n=1 Tax=Lasiodiplodia mahajangana TaxID=1108764 RepID=A0ACC2JMK2_9PEZI|nr:hypothetical protein O1611_g4898 [Lasiodiplodia mahajangana]